MKKNASITASRENIERAWPATHVLGLRRASASWSLASDRGGVLPIGESNLELIEPKGNDGLRKFLDKRGPGLHHVAIEVEGIEDALALLKSLGVPLIDETPRAGARGHKVAFVHPKATGGVLIELVEPDEAHRPG